MTLDNDTVRQMARLARLDISDDDLDHYRNDLSRILELVAQMDSCDTSGIIPMTHPFDSALRMREDLVTEENQRDKFQQIAPSVERGFYLVPRVVE